MPELTEIGKRIVLKHRSTSEIHWGVIDDVKTDGYVVRMESSADLLCDGLLVDTEYYADRWVVMEVLND